MEPARTKIVVIGGPTATGKTAASVLLAQALARAGRPGEVVNADSTQVYRGMDIGTAKPSPEERSGVPHHLLDIRDPDQALTAAAWAALADEAIAQIVARGGVPIVVGGTGFWLRALLEGLFEAPPVDPSVRARLEAEATTDAGRARLRARLEEVDPVSARTIHPNDLFRTVRALEVAETIGRPISALRAEHARGAGADAAGSGGVDAAGGPAPARPERWRYDAWFAALSLPRELLYAKIDARQRAQVEAGLLDEYRRLLARGFSPGLRTLNGLCYRHMRLVNEGMLSLEQAIALDCRDNRRYAKRQFTWFRGVPGVHWYDARTDVPRLVSDVFAFLELGTPPTGD